MSLSLYEAVEEIRELAIRELAMKHPVPGTKKRLWVTILAQVAKQNTCDGSLADTLLEIIRAYLKKPNDQDIISMWLDTETGGGDDPEELIAEYLRIDLEMELLAEMTRLAWDEAKEKKRWKITTFFAHALGGPACDAILGKL